MSGPRATTTHSSSSSPPLKRTRLSPESVVDHGVMDTRSAPIASRLALTPARGGVGGTGAGRPKKLIIQPLLRQPKLPANFQETMWSKLSQAVAGVHCKRAIPFTREELYAGVQDMCLHRMGADLYQRLEAVCRTHIQKQTASLVDQAADTEAYLRLVNGVWRDHCEQMVMISAIFLHLDRTYVKQASATSQAVPKSLWEMGLGQFAAALRAAKGVLTKTRTGILAVIQQERQGNQVDRSLLKSLLHMFLSLQLYETEFEPVFLAETNEFYAAEAAEYMQQTEVADFLKHVERRLREESERVHNYLDVQTRKQLISAVERSYLTSHSAAILNKGFVPLISDNRLDDLARLHTLFARVSALPELRTRFSEYIKRAGRDIVMNEENDASMVQDLLDYKARLSTVLDSAFRNDETFAYAVKESFESFINQRPNKPAELIAKFIDQRLKVGHKDSSEQELDAMMDNVMTLFRFIQGKDVFEAFYKKDLAKRLLLNRSASSDLEKQMISKLKTECGASFTNKLEGMFKDIDLSRDIMQSFRTNASCQEELRKVVGGNLELNVNVLTMSYWPTYPQNEIKLPVPLAMAQEVFKTFYLGRHNGRQLRWQPSLGQCFIDAHFPACGKKLLQVSFFQGLVLLQFNNPHPNGITVGELIEATGIEDAEVRRTLQSLACARVRPLKKVPMSRDVADDDRFFINEAFDNKLMKIRINQIQLKETKEEQKKTTETVFADRHMTIDAAIVRIMKTRKTLDHTALLTELFAQLKFPASAQDMKKRIESLIEREYLERDKDNKQLYHYLA